MFNTALFFILLFLGVPIAFVLGISSIIYIVTTGNVGILNSLPQRMFNGVQNFGLLAIPMFVLVGELMNSGGITKRLINFASVTIGSIRGGLAYVNVAANMFLASIVGSANAQTAIMSRTIVPEMEKKGYSRDFSSALTAASSIVGPLIPPSMPFIIYGVVAGQSIGSLFIAGIIPGLLFALAFSILIYFISIKRDFPKEERAGYGTILKTFGSVIPALSIPILVIWGILAGVFTPTESAAFAVLIALISGMFIYKELKIKDLPKILINTVLTSATVTFLVATSNIFGWVLTFEQVPQMIASAILGFAESPLVFLLLVNVILLVVGMFIDGLAALILLVPILLPIALQYGIDPIHFGLIMVINLTLGLMTPPVGTVLFITSSLADVKYEKLLKALVPFLVVSFIVLLIITYFPQISMFLIN
ncbi:TRAP transporter large permease [Alkalihalobacterium alkalinitrilicum]|uniref:TRAP transporter large permease n=1 Tax=Alkalihalobacterium alkalinitrilicum TaxID=427920 RepID=UPI0009951B55|nr:TRAP transporter large permease [Alkalihalobacterium alkalinitrilicum]